MFNTITIFGNLVRDVEVKAIRDDLSVAKFSIAHSKGIKQKDGTWKNEATFIDCVYFSDKIKNLTKGTGVIITGHLKQENWVHAETGVNKSKLVIMVEDVLVASKITNFKNSDDESTINYADRLKEPELDKIKFAKINKMLESIEMDVKPSDELPF